MTDRKKHRKRNGAAMKAKWANPEFRARMRAAMKRKRPASGEEDVIGRRSPDDFAREMAERMPTTAKVPMPEPKAPPSLADTMAGALNARLPEPVPMAG